MKNIKFNKKTAIGIIIAVFFVLVSTSLFLSTYLEHKIKHTEIHGFNLRVLTAEVNLLKRQVNLSNIELSDTLGLMMLNIDQVNLKGIHLLTLLFNGNINIDHLILQNPRVRVDTVFFNSDLFTQPGSNHRKSKQINIETLLVSDAELLFVSSDSLRNDTLYHTHLNINVDNIKQNGKPNRFSYQSTSFNRLHFILQDGSFNFGKGLYSFQYDSIDFDSDKMSLIANDLHLVSLYSKYEIGRKTGFQTDWFAFTFKNLELNKIRLDMLLSDLALVFSEGRIGDFQGKAFKDKRLPFPDKPDTKLPMAMLNGLPVGLHCDSFFIDRAHIEYSERVDDSDKPGMVYFDKLSAKIKHLSTVDSLITKPTTMRAQARVMGEALLQANFTFPNKKYPKPYRTYGKMGPMPLTSFNPIIKQNAFVKAETGNITNLSFDFSYTNDTSSGNLLFEYDDLKISILDKKNFNEKGLMSMLVNSFVLHKKNIKGSKGFREGTVNFERNKKKSIFNYWWKSVLSGLKSIAIF